MDSPRGSPIPGEVRDMAELERLRREIDEVDEELFRLFFRRFQLVEEIGKIKKQNGLTLTDERRESEVRDRWRSLAKKYGIPEVLADNLLNTLFSVSKMRELNPSSKRRITLVGYGGMARSLASLFRLVRHEVVVTGRNDSKAKSLAQEFNLAHMPMSQAFQWGELIILALPPEGVKSDSLERTLPLAKGRVVMDILSSKASLFAGLEELSARHGFRYVSIHPLFGPYLYPVGERIAIIPSSTSGDVEEVVTFWRESGLVPVLTSLDEHEKAMALVQVLPHFFLMGLNAGLDSVAKELNVDYSRFHTTNFRELHKILKRIKDLEGVIMEIQSYNPYAGEARRIGVRELYNLFSRLEGDKNDSVRLEDRK
ncbi:chorismate mutase [Metallosphaera yellowstonensis MK1]|uniref:Chorismate mutase n=2 Tax=Metallosphaera TaxID=41980 RepID=H2C9K1_9CREN|nr:chorismate mutase [Metallosphaera yellowstonensis MK1]